MTIREVFKNGKKQWCLDAGKIDGKRQVSFHPSKAAANQKANSINDDRKNIGKAWAQLSARDRWEVLEVKRDVEKAGYTLRKVWNAFQIFKEQGAKVIASKPLIDATNEFVESRRTAKRDKGYADWFANYLKMFCGGRGSSTVDQVTPAVISDWLKTREVADSTLATEITRLATFFNWCMKKEYCASNPVQVSKPGATIQPKGILSPDEIKRCLGAALTKDPALIRYIAVILYGGARPKHEAPAAEIHDTYVRIPPEAAKRIGEVKEERFLHMTPQLKRWLGAAKRKQNTQNLRRRLLRVRTLAGVPWPKNCLRHSFCTYSAPVNGLSWTAEQAGHTEKMQRRHYKRPVPREEAEKVWSITPAAAKAAYEKWKESKA